MRIKKPEERSSKRARLSVDTAILVTLLKKQPLEKRELIKNSAVGDSGFSRVEPLLLREELIKIVDGKYVLFNYESLNLDMEEVFKELKDENKDVVRIEELANMVGKPPEAIKKHAYSLGKKYGILIYYE